MTPTPPSDLPLLGIEWPNPIGWWPLAWGWWVVIAAVLLGSAALVWWLRQRHLATLPIRQALDELQHIEAHYSRDNRQLVQAVSMLLRRVAMNQYGRAATASLVGTQWALFLQSKGMSKDLATALSEMPYRPVEKVEVDKLVYQVRRWIKAQAKPQEVQHV